MLTLAAEAKRGAAGGGAVSMSSLRRVWPALAALFVALSVLIVNGRPLIYFDTASYLDQGQQLLGLSPAPANPGSTEPAAAAGPEAQAGGSTVVGSRSIAYGLVLALVTAAAGLPGVVALNLGIVWLSTLILARHLAEGGATVPAGRLAAFGLLAGSLGALPFYVAFAMPDILAPALILSVATLFVHFRALSLWERAASLTLALFAIVAHPSHLMLAVLLVPVALFARPAAAGRRFALALVLGGLLVGGGLAERLVFGVASERFLHKRVVYLPFLTARLIDDGPGLAYLAGRCPDPRYPTCALHAALSASVDPARLDAPNILFSRAPERGSYALLPDAERAAVATHQLAFARDVVAAAPFAVAAAVARNVAIQLGQVSIEMTVPNGEVIAAARRLSDGLPPSLGEGRLVTAPRGWMRPLAAVHAAVYLASLALIGRLGYRRRLSRSQGAVVIVVLGGILANAVICGAISEPAHRYGARVMFLLPLLAAMLALATRRGDGARLSSRPEA